MQIRYLPEFWEDVEVASQWLSQERPQSGKDFVQDVIASVERVIQMPQSHRSVEGTTRRCVIRSFRYLLFYEHVEDSILFLGVLHGSREVNRWLQKRRGKSE